MRAAVLKQLRLEFDKMIDEVAPGFRKIKVSGGVKTFTYYERKVSDRLAWYIILENSPDEDDFTVGIRWSRLDRAPINLIPEFPRKGFKGSECYFRLPIFWTAEDEWFELATKLTPLQMAQS